MYLRSPGESMYIGDEMFVHALAQWPEWHG